VSRETRGGLALVALRLDTALPPHVLEEIATHMDAKLARSIDL
jgi:hypothetical protein